ncbi:MAG: isochorismatase family protein [Pseudaminobacter sp.]|nr:isochorismatase family protein [Pseudaminobacter sp.]
MKQSLTLPSGRTAAIFIDLQEEHRQDRRFLAEGFDRVIVNAQLLLQAARANGVSAYHYAYVADPGLARPFHPVLPDGKSVFSAKDDPLTAICPEVAPAGDERLFIKAQASVFGDGLGRELKAEGIEWLVVAGVWTEACVDATVKDAQALGFRVALVKDACASGTAAMHQVGILNLANRLYGGAVADTPSACRLMAGEAANVWRVEGAVPLRFTFENAGELYAAL